MWDHPCEFSTSAPNEVRIIVVTEHPTGDGKPTCAIQYCCFKKMVGDPIRSRMKWSLAVSVLRNAMGCVPRSKRPVTRTGQSLIVQWGHADLEEEAAYVAREPGSGRRTSVPPRRHRETTLPWSPSSHCCEEGPGHEEVAVREELRLQITVDRDQVQPPPSSTGSRQTDPGRVRADLLSRRRRQRTHPECHLNRGQTRLLRYSV